CYSPDSRLIAASLAPTLVVVERQTGQIVLQEKQTDDVRDFAFSADSRRLLVATSKPPVKIWDLGKREVVHRWTGKDMVSVRDATLSPDGRLAAIACRDLIVVDLAAEKEIAQLNIEGHPQELLHVAFTPDGQRLVSASRYVQAWNTRDWS